MGGSARFILGLHESASPALRQYIISLLQSKGLTAFDLDDSEDGCLVVAANSDAQSPDSCQRVHDEADEALGACSFGRTLAAQHALESLQVRDPVLTLALTLASDGMDANQLQRSEALQYIAGALQPPRACTCTDATM